MQMTAKVTQDEFDSHKRILSQFMGHKLNASNSSGARFKRCDVQAFIDEAGAIRVFVHDASDLASAIYFRVVVEK